MDAINHNIYNVLKAIKENDGFPGPVPAIVRANILGKWATVEVSPLTGLDVQWELTAEGKKKLREFNTVERYRKKAKARPLHPRLQRYEAPKPAPLTTEVRDALKSIMDHGHPGTEKMDILSRIQLGSRYVEGFSDYRGGYVAAGGLAVFHEGKWYLSHEGKEIAKNHIRKAECAQFTGKVR